MNAVTKPEIEAHCPHCSVRLEDLEDRFCRNCREDLRAHHVSCVCGFSALKCEQTDSMNGCPRCGREWVG